MSSSESFDFPWSSISFSATVLLNSGLGLLWMVCNHQAQNDLFSHHLVMETYCSHVPLVHLGCCCPYATRFKGLQYLSSLAFLFFSTRYVIGAKAVESLVAQTSFTLALNDSTMGSIVDAIFHDDMLLIEILIFAKSLPSMLLAMARVKWV